MALIENHFPIQIISLIYSPFVFVILFLNCLRVQISWYIASFTLLAASMLLIGLFISLIFLGIKAFGVYLARHGVPGEKEDSDDEESEPNESRAQFEGGCQDGSYVGPRVEDVLN